jgi:uncharacterized C2H2 Zn-finger protein
MANQTIKCPYCPCIFLNKTDYTWHMQTFSYYEQAHKVNWMKEMERRQKYE